MLLNNKEEKWLAHIRLLSDGAGMYPGARKDDIPNKTANGLYKKGMIESFIPHNFAHKERWIITQSGRSFFEAK